MPTITLDLALFALGAALCFGAGWQTESWHTQAAHAVVLQGEINASNAAEQRAADVATNFEAASASTRESQEALLQKWSVVDAQPHSPCLLTAGTRKLLKSASTDNHPTR